MVRSYNLCKLIAIVFIVALILISSLAIMLLKNSTSTNMLDSHNTKEQLKLSTTGNIVSLARLSRKYRFIIEQGDQDNSSPFVSWVETNTSIDLDSVAQQLEANGYTITGSQPGVFIEVSKTFYCFPDFCERYGCPQATVQGRIYSNGTILFYTLVAPGSIAAIAYLDDDFEQVVPVTIKAMYEVLGILGLDSYKYCIVNSIVSFPEARYIVFLYPSRSWFDFPEYSGAIGFQGTYSVRSNATIYYAGYLVIVKSSGYTVNYHLKIDGNTVASSPYAGNGAIRHVTGSIDANQYFQPSSSHGVVAVCENYYGYGYFVIAVIAR